MTNKYETIGSLSEFHAMMLVGTKQLDKTKQYKLTIDEYNEAREKSNKQNNLLQSLAREFYVSGHSSVPEKENEEWIKGDILCRVGWIKEYIYTTINGEMHRSTQRPLNYVKCKPVPKSWGNIGVRRATQAIKLLIADMIQSGCNSKKFNEIISGAEGEYDT